MALGIFTLCSFSFCCGASKEIRIGGIYPLDIYSKAALTGRVLDKRTTEPLVGAALLLDQRHKTSTDVQGYFTFSFVDSGKHSLWVVYVGYHPVEADTVLLVAGKVTILEIFLAEIPPDNDAIEIVHGR